MSSGGGLDEGLIRVTNYQNHPTNDMYKVFFFYKKEQADYFETLLKEKSIFYERDITEKNNEPFHIFGIKKKDLKAVYKLNDITIGKFRNKLIPNKYSRIGVVIFGLVVILIALLGYIKTR